MVAGFNVVDDPEGAKHHLSYMPQRFGLYEDLTVDENIRFYADLFGVRKDERVRRSAQLLQAAGMSEFRTRLAGKLSGGMKQKLGLVCALIHRPKVILLDEPTTGVDPVSRRDFWRILYDLVSEGVAILTSTAYLDEAERCHRVALLHQGKLLFCDTPPRLKEKLGKGILDMSFILTHFLYRIEGIGYFEPVVYDVLGQFGRQAYIAAAVGTHVDDQVFYTRPVKVFERLAEKRFQFVAIGKRAHYHKRRATGGVHLQAAGVE